MNEPQMPDPLEEALLELVAADKARLFARSNVEARRLVGREVSRNPWHVAIRMASAAALVAMAVGLWGWMYGNHLYQPHEGTGVTSHAAGSTVASPGEFVRCISGPTGVSKSSCDVSDLDADGDIDLADYGRYQLAYAEITR